MLKFAGLSSALFASSSGHTPRTVPASGSEDSTVLLVGRHGQRVLRGQGRRRASWEDPALPTPHSIHELGQHRRRLHPFALPRPPMASQEQRYRQLDENSDPDDPTPAGNDTRVTPPQPSPPHLAPRHTPNFLTPPCVSVLCRCPWTRY